MQDVSHSQNTCYITQTFNFLCSETGFDKLQNVGGGGWGGGVGGVMREANHGISHL